MNKKAKAFKPVPQRFQPKSFKIIYEDHDIIVIDKPTGLLTMSNERERDRTAYAFLNEYVRKGQVKSRNRVFIVHRLDRETSGLIIFAKTEQAKGYLQEEWANFSKSYYAVVHGTPEKPEGKISSFLAENGIHKMFATKDKIKGKFAETEYKVVKESGDYSLLDINLLTGRKHQIRVHLADEGHPIVGDKKYGNGEKGVKRLTLHSATLSITHPYSQEKMTFKTEIPAYFEVFMKKR
ncbi:MAG: RluA family pseudouridine synthase [Akkermansiaceae bacterium]